MGIAMKWLYFYPPIHILVVLLGLQVSRGTGYLLIVPEKAPPGQVIFNATLPRLGRSRFYTLNLHRNGHFVKKLIGVDSSSGAVFIREKLDCRGVWYPNLFTLHVDSVLDMNKIWKRRSTRFSPWDVWKMVSKSGTSEVRSEKVRKSVPGVQYYSMPLRVFIIGEQCSLEDVQSPFLAEDEGSK